MKILVLSFYYSPDLSAGSFRTTALVKSLLENSSKETKIHVITTLPNRYRSFNSEAPAHERNERLEINRIKLPPHQSGLIDQSRAFVAFWRKVSEIILNQDYDLVYATSSRLMTAVLGAWIATRKKTRLYLDIRDIFVDTINDVLPRKITLLIKPLFSLLERWAINRADRVNLVSEGFSSYFLQRYPNQHFTFFTNGIDAEFISDNKMAIDKKLKGPIRVIYAGNMGEGQGLHMIIPELAKKLEGRAQFVLIGDGGRKSELESEIEQSGCKNIELKTPVRRDVLIQAYRDADVLFLHLNDYDAFKKVLPSKLFEYAALGKPIWAGVSGYAAEFVNNEIVNAEVFHPCDADAAISAFDKLVIKDNPRDEFVKKYARANIMHDMAGDIMMLLKKQST